MSEVVTAPSGKPRSCPSCGTALGEADTACPSCKTAWVEPGPAPDPAAATIEPVTGELPEPELKPTAEPPTAETVKSGWVDLEMATADTVVKPQPPRDLEVGETLNDHWTLEAKLGEGTLGHVFLATDLKLGRKVAVKGLGIANLQDELMKRFEREAQVLARIDHPNIGAVYAVGRHRDVPFLVMRHLEGGSLWDQLDTSGGRMTPEQLLPMLKQVCAALGYIHGKNLVHKDLKPSNIFVSPQGKVTLLDVGLARGYGTSLAKSGTAWGTPEFMAPEQIVGEKPVDGRADLYALGVVLYRMLANQPPFLDANEQALMQSHLTQPRPDLAQVWSGASPALSLVLQKAMAIKPEDRFQTADELAQAFESAVKNPQATTATPQPEPAVPPPPAAPPAPVVSPAPAMKPPPSAPRPPPASAPRPPPSVPPPAPSAPPPPPPANAPKPAPPPPPPAVAPATAVAKPAATTPAPPGVPPVAVAKPAPPPPTVKPLTAAPPVPVSPPAAPPARPPVLTSAKHIKPPIDELDDDQTEMGQLPAELMGLVTGDDDPPVEPPPKVAEPAKPSHPKPLLDGARRHANAPTNPAAPPTAPLARGPSPTLADRPATARAERAAVSSNAAGVPAAAPVHKAERTVSDDGDTGPATRTDPGEEYDDDDIKTQIGGPEMQAIIEAAAAREAAALGEGPEGATGLLPSPPVIEPPAKTPPTPLEAPLPTPPPPGTPRPSTPGRAQPRQTRKSQVSPGKKEASGVSMKQPPPPPEAPAWMHPYVLVTGGLLLLALGFLIGVLLR